ncbi:MAG: tyrosine-type recombinase/integrase [Amphritea sp.]
MAFAALVMLTASRKGEILRIKLTDIHDNHLLILDQKTGKKAYYLKTPALEAAIEMAIDSQKVGSDYLLPNTKGECHMNKDDRCQPFDKSWRRSMERAIKNTDLQESFTRHDLRAKVGSDAETEGRAQELLGHTTADMTRKHYR